MIGNLIAAGASLAGGFLNKSSADKARDAQSLHQAQQLQAQKDFAQKGIRWRVDDAKKAGIHPLYALGANTTSYTPTSASFAADNSVGNAVAAAGQDVGRAINATRTAPERIDAYQKSVQAISLENMQLDTEIKKTQLASNLQRLKQNANPPLPTTGPLEIEKLDKATPLMAGGNRISVDPRWSDGQTFEDRWGEWGGSLAGLATMAADLYNQNSETAAALQRKYPIDFSRRGSFREMSRELIGRR